MTGYNVSNQEKLAYMAHEMGRRMWIGCSLAVWILSPRAAKYGALLPPRPAASSRSSLKTQNIAS